MKENKKSRKIGVQIIRWIGVLPAFVLSLFFAYLISKVYYWDIGVYPGNNRFFVDLFSYGFGGFASVFVGAAIAPRRRGIVAIILCTILSILFILLFGYMDMGFYDSKIKSAIIVIVVIAGGIMGVKSAYDEFDE